ncbi:hypothetical protein GGS21DRAFT_491342 [Xylaria nigripes]|nr:hypothetical protein GGS21DRAFT_491342 [Xylaria nigripes]
MSGASEDCRSDKASDAEGYSCKPIASYSTSSDTDTAQDHTSPSPLWSDRHLTEQLTEEILQKPDIVSFYCPGGYTLRPRHADVSPLLDLKPDITQARYEVPGFQISRITSEYEVITPLGDNSPTIRSSDDPGDRSAQQGAQDISPLSHHWATEGQRRPD